MPDIQSNHWDKTLKEANFNSDYSYIETKRNKATKLQQKQGVYTYSIILMNNCLAGAIVYQFDVGVR